MRALVSYPGNFMHAQQAARAFDDSRTLAAFVTGLCFDDRDLLPRLACHLPDSLGERVCQELRRRQVSEIPRNRIIRYPTLDVLRTIVSRSFTNPIYADIAWDAMSHRFDRAVARRHLDGIDLVFSFEYTARFTFEEARRRGIARILALPSRDSKEFEEIRSEEETRFPELRNRHQRYFARRFANRYERRRAEIALADLIVTNSEATKRSHVKAGADPAKMVAVPLAGPPPIDVVAKPEADIDRRLSVIWAGSLSLRKGAHYFLDAWRALSVGNRARACVYGRVELPERALRPLPQGLVLQGSYPQSELFSAFERADVLVFPTLSDGFGMVVTEAFSRGLPVITTDRAGASDFVDHGRNGFLVPAADPGALVDALRWCLDNRKALYEMRFHALRTAGRWQWSDHRRLLVTEIEKGLRRAGYAAQFRHPNGGERSGCEVDGNAFAS